MQNNFALLLNPPPSFKSFSRKISQGLLILSNPVAYNVQSLANFLSFTPEQLSLLTSHWPMPYVLGENNLNNAQNIPISIKQNVTSNATSQILEEFKTDFQLLSLEQYNSMYESQTTVTQEKSSVIAKLMHNNFALLLNPPPSFKSFSRKISQALLILSKPAAYNVQSLANFLSFTPEQLSLLTSHWPMPYVLAEDTLNNAQNISISIKQNVTSNATSQILDEFKTDFQLLSLEQYNSVDQSQTTSNPIKYPVSAKLMQNNFALLLNPPPSFKSFSRKISQALLILSNPVAYNVQSYANFLSFTPEQLSLLTSHWPMPYVLAENTLNNSQNISISIKQNVTSNATSQILDEFKTDFQLLFLEQYNSVHESQTTVNQEKSSVIAKLMHNNFALLLNPPPSFKSFSRKISQALLILSNPAAYNVQSLANFLSFTPEQLSLLTSHWPMPYVLAENTLNNAQNISILIKQNVTSNATSKILNEFKTNFQLLSLEQYNSVHESQTTVNQEKSSVIAKLIQNNFALLLNPPPSFKSFSRKISQELLILSNPAAYNVQSYANFLSFTPEQLSLLTSHWPMPYVLGKNNLNNAQNIPILIKQNVTSNATSQILEEFKTDFQLLSLEQYNSVHGSQTTVNQETSSVIAKLIQNNFALLLNPPPSFKSFSRKISQALLILSNPVAYNVQSYANFLSFTPEQLSLLTSHWPMPYVLAEDTLNNAQNISISIKQNVTSNATSQILDEFKTDFQLLSLEQYNSVDQSQTTANPIKYPVSAKLMQNNFALLLNPPPSFKSFSRKISQALLILSNPAAYNVQSYANFLSFTPEQLSLLTSHWPMPYVLAENTLNNSQNISISIKQNVTSNATSQILDEFKTDFQLLFLEQYNSVHESQTTVNQEKSSVIAKLMHNNFALLLNPPPSFKSFSRKISQALLILSNPAAYNVQSLANFLSFTPEQLSLLTSHWPMPYVLAENTLNNAQNISISIKQNVTF